HPLGEDWDDHWIDPEGDFSPYFLMGEEGFKPPNPKKDKRVKDVRKVWWVCSDDLYQEDEDAELEMSGKHFSQCMGSGYVYEKYDDALKDFAKYSEPIAWLWKLAQSSKEPAKRLARAVLDGDKDSLPVLADALEEAGDPLANKVRTLFKRGGSVKAKS